MRERPNIFLTGEVQCGKSTMIRTYLSLHPEWKRGGFLTVTNWQEEEKGLGTVHLIPAQGGACTAENRVMNRKAYGRPEVSAETFDRLGPAYLDCPGADILLMDELGNAERHAAGFCRAVLEALDGEIPVIGVVKPSAGPLLDAVRNHESVEVIEVRAEDRKPAWIRLLELAGENEKEKLILYDIGQSNMI